MRSQPDGLEDRLRAECWRLRDELELAHGVLGELTGLSLDGVQELLRLHRRASGLQPSELTVDELVAALGRRWWPTGVITRAVLVNGGSDMSSRQRSDFRKRLTALLREARDAGLVESRRAPDPQDPQGRGRTEWRRA